MTISRRTFLATAGSAALLCPKEITAPLQATVHRAPPPTPGPGTQPVPLAIPATMPMGSGAPLGGIGAGFVELRADGCFHEWQIFNAGPWAMNAPSTTAPPGPGPQYLRFLLRAKTPSAPPQLRRLYLRSDESDLYTLPFVQDVESIDYLAWFPMTGLRYHDPTLPVRVSAQAFSPFIPGRARDSASPGFHLAFTLENTAPHPIEVSLAGFLDNPLASALPDRRLANDLALDAGAASLFLQTSAVSSFPSGIGNLCFSVHGGQPSAIAGTFREYAGVCRWKTPRVNYMLLSVFHELLATGRLPNSPASRDPSLTLPSEAQIDTLSDAEVHRALADLANDALLARVLADARAAGDADERDLLREIRQNLLDRDGKPRLSWGAGALASTVTLAPGETTEIRFTLSWFFPHHLTPDGRPLGHMYSNWFSDARQVDRFLDARYAEHRAATEAFARTLADTSLGDPMAFAWSGQLSTLVFNTWWVKDGGYAIWEGLGCCGLSTTDVDYQGSFPIVALFPELKLSQMRRILELQNSQGQVPHNFDGSFDRIDVPGFARVDMNPQFVMMVCRDYLWTADRDYLASMWPHVVRAMAFTQSLDTNGDGLPDRDTGFQTYDQWRMRGTPSYIASLWIGALRAAVVLARALGKTTESSAWQEQLAKASAAFDSMLFNGDYYSLWVDGVRRDELCMTDQVSGEWFDGLLGLPSTLNPQNLARAIDSIFRSNFNPEFGLHNATAPRRGPDLLALNNLQAGGLWSGIEFAFASFLMDRGRYPDGVRIVEAIHRRYLRAGQPWNHVECGGHYSRAMSSWATLLAATGFKPDLPNQALTLIPAVPGDFHAPWVISTGFGSVQRAGSTLRLACVQGSLPFRSLRLGKPPRTALLAGRSLAFHPAEDGNRAQFSDPVTLSAGQTLEIAF